jgi:NitT/TauT family transport system permease protein
MMEAMRRSMREIVLGAVGVLLFLFAWEIAGEKKLGGSTLPAFSATIGFALNPAKRQMFLAACGASFSMVAAGYVLGLVLGIVLALAVHFFPALRSGIDNLVSLVNSIPALALAPLFIVLISRDLAGMAIASLYVLFIIYVAATSGLTAAHKRHLDLFASLGATRRQKFLMLELPSALPTIAGGMKYSVPAAFIGAILGEWFGASHGLGLLMMTAMQNFQILLLWSAVLITACASLALYGLTSILEQFLRNRYR